MKLPRLFAALATLALPALAAAQMGPVTLSNPGGHTDETEFVTFIAPNTGGVGGVGPGGAALDPEERTNGQATSYKAYISRSSLGGRTLNEWASASDTISFVLPDVPQNPGLDESIAITPTGQDILIANTMYYVSLSYFDGTTESTLAQPIGIQTGDDATAPGDFGSVTATRLLSGDYLVEMTVLPADDANVAQSGPVRCLRMWSFRADLPGLVAPPSGAAAANSWFLAHEGLATSYVHPMLQLPGDPGANQNILVHAQDATRYYWVVAAEDNGLETFPTIGNRGHLNTVTVFTLDFAPPVGGGRGGASGGGAGLAGGCGSSAGGSLALLSLVAALAAAFKRAA